jgi:hypothetical protein
MNHILGGGWDWAAESHPARDSKGWDLDVG